MKTSFLALFLALIVTFAMINNSSQTKTKTLGSLRKNTDTNDEVNKNSESLASSNNQETRNLPNLDGLKTPEYRVVNNSMNKGHKVDAEGVNNKGVYYDGKEKMKRICAQKTDSKNCLKEKACGWCDDNNKCLSAQQKSPCKKIQFYFDDTSANWSPQTSGDINIHTGGKLVIAPHPDFKNILIDGKFRKSSN